MGNTAGGVVKTGISKKWSRLSKCWLGNAEGIHCHWCKSMKSLDGEVHCINKKSKYCDGERIRCLEGESIAKYCRLFKLNNWYKDDKNYENYFIINKDKEIK